MRAWCFLAQFLAFLALFLGAASAAEFRPPDALTKKPNAVSTAVAEQKNDPTNLTSIITAINALTVSGTENLALERTAKRLQVMRALITEAIIGAEALKEDAPAPSLNFDAAALLCEPRTDYVILAAHLNDLAMVSKEVSRLSQAEKIDGLSNAISSFFVTYAGTLKKKEEAAKAKNAVLAACYRDLNEYTEVYYGTPLAASEVSLTLMLVPFAALMKGIIELISPTIEAVAQIRDRQAREKAIKAFLTKHNTRIRDAAVEVSEQIKVRLTARRMQSVGKFVEQITIARAIPFDPKGFSSCKKDMVKKDPDTNQYDVTFDTVALRKVPGAPDQWSRPNVDFILCEAQVWAAYAGPLTAALKAAEEYDVLADAAPDEAQIAARTLTERIEKATSSKGNSKELWEAALELVNLAQGVVEALSVEKREKVQKQIDALASSF